MNNERAIATARRLATHARTNANRVACDDEENALHVAARQFDTVAEALIHDDTTAAHAALAMAHNYANCEDVIVHPMPKAADSIAALIGN